MALGLVMGPRRSRFTCLALALLATIALPAWATQAQADETCDSNVLLQGDVRSFVREQCPREGSVSGYLHLKGGMVYAMQDRFSAIHFQEEAVATGGTFLPIALPDNYSEIYEHRERYRHAWVKVSGNFAPRACDEQIFAWCPTTKALFRATRVDVVQSADYFALADLKKSTWEGASPIHEVVAADLDRIALVELGQRLARVIGQRQVKAAKALFPEVASEALYDKYLKPGARINWLLFSPERSINTAASLRLYRLGSREADVDRVIAFACYNHDPKHADVWPDSYFDLTFAHVGDPFICYPLVFDDGKWSVNFHALL